jgi:CRISPR-associated protein Cas2
VALTAYMVTYDIADPDRLRKVFQVMRGAGQHVQFSVFHCVLSDVAVEELNDALTAVMNLREDQVLFIDLGPADGRAATCIRALGQAWKPPERKAVIL